MFRPKERGERVVADSAYDPFVVTEMHMHFGTVSLVSTSECARAKFEFIFEFLQRVVPFLVEGCVDYMLSLVQDSKQFGDKVSVCCECASV